MRESRRLKKRKKIILLSILAVLAVLTSAIAGIKVLGENAKYSTIAVINNELEGQSSESKYETENNSGSDEIIANTSLTSNSNISVFSIISTSTRMAVSATASIYSIDNAGVAAGETFSAILKPDGTVWTSGNNTYGQIGNGNIANVNTTELTQVVGVNGEGTLDNIKQISAGRYFMVALTNDGKVVTWGYNNYGQLGNNSTTNSGTPIYVIDVDGNEINNIKQISAGGYHVLALTEDGEIYSWGYNNCGQLGINSTVTTKYATKVLTPITTVDEDGTSVTEYVSLDNIKYVSAGESHSTAIVNDGTVVTWGYNAYGQLGNGATANATYPIQIDISDVEKISAGGLQTIALKNDGTVWAWGMNRYGNLGINTASTTTSNAAYKKTSPVQVLISATESLSDIVDITSLYETSFALTSSGEVYGWGLNTSGQIGDYTIVNKTVATKVLKSDKTSLTNVKKLADGSRTNTMMTIDEQGYIYGSGVASSNQLINGRTANTYFAIDINSSYLNLSGN